MGNPAACVGDYHFCPESNGQVPHNGGEILPPCCCKVFIGGRPAARVKDSLFCVGPTDEIAVGSKRVFIGGSPAARKGDWTAHGGRIQTGSLTVFIGG